MLAGIRNIYVKCSEKDENFIKSELNTGEEYGISIRFIKSDNELEKINTMVVFDNPFGSSK